MTGRRKIAAGASLKTRNLAGALSLVVVSFLLIAGPRTPVQTAATSRGTNSSSRPSIHTATSAYGRLPMSFVPNRGQANPHVQFVARGGGYAVALTSNELELALTKLVNHSVGRRPKGDG